MIIDFKAWVDNSKKQAKFESNIVSGHSRNPTPAFGSPSKDVFPLHMHKFCHIATAS